MWPTQKPEHTEESVLLLIRLPAAFTPGSISHALSLAKLNVRKIRQSSHMLRPTDLLRLPTSGTAFPGKNHRSAPLDGYNFFGRILSHDLKH
jgi:hypothetical protein